MGNLGFDQPAYRRVVKSGPYVRRMKRDRTIIINEKDYSSLLLVGSREGLLFKVCICECVCICVWGVRWRFL